MSCLFVAKVLFIYGLAGRHLANMLLIFCSVALHLAWIFLILVRVLFIFGLAGFHLARVLFTFGLLAYHLA